MKLSVRRRLAYVAALLMLVLVLLCGALEIWARTSLPNPFSAEDELRGMYQNAREEGSVRTVPGFRGEFTVEGRTVAVELNELGLRNPPLPEQTPDQLRVLCLGDSFVFGYGVAQSEAFPAILERELATRLERGVAVGNAGVPGYGTVEQVRCLRRLKESFDPDAVVVSIYVGNDFIDDRYLAKFVQGGFSMTGPWARLMRQSFRARLCLRSRAWTRFELYLMQRGSSRALRPVPTPEQAAAFAGFPPQNAPNQSFAGFFMDAVDERRTWDDAGEPPIPRVLETTRESLSTLQALAAPAPVQVILLPTWWHLSEPGRNEVMQEMGLDPANFPLGLCQERIAAVCAELGLPVIDFFPEFRAHEDPLSLYLPENRHLSVAGHTYVAQRLAEELVTQPGMAPR